MEKINRKDYDGNCPKCNHRGYSDLETNYEVAWDDGWVGENYECENCGQHYTVNYKTTFESVTYEPIDLSLQSDNIIFDKIATFEKLTRKYKNERDASKEAKGEEAIIKVLNTDNGKENEYKTKSFFEARVIAEFWPRKLKDESIIEEFDDTNTTQVNLKEYQIRELLEQSYRNGGKNFMIPILESIL